MFGAVIKNLEEFAAKHLCWNHFFSKVANLKIEALLKKRILHMRYSVNFAEFFRTTSFKEHL